RQRDVQVARDLRGAHGHPVVRPPAGDGHGAGDGGVCKGASEQGGVAHAAAEVHRHVARDLRVPDLHAVVGDVAERQEAGQGPEGHVAAHADGLVRERADGGPAADAAGVAHVDVDAVADVRLLQRVDVEARRGPAGGGDVIDSEVAGDVVELRAQVRGIDAD